MVIDINKLGYIMKNIFALLMGLVFAATASHAQSDYRVQPGDTLQIEVLEDASLDRTVLVTPDGRFAFPFAGSVRASGRTVDQIRRNLTASIQGSFASAPTVFVSVSALNPEEREPSTINVYFMGEINTPGLREVAPGTTFLQGLSQAGGFTSFAATKRVQLRRTNHLSEDGGTKHFAGQCMPKRNGGLSHFYVLTKLQASNLGSHITFAKYASSSAGDIFAIFRVSS